MKIAILNTWKNGAVHNIMKPMADYLNTLDGVECDYLTLRDDLADPGFDKSFDDYDIVHVGYFMNMQYIKDHIEVPFTCTVHHIAHHALERVHRFLCYNMPFGIATADPFCQRQLGQMNITGVKIIPYSFDHGPYKLDKPKAQTIGRKFTVAYLGCDSEAKRFSMIEEAAAQAGYECNGIDRNTRNEEDDYLPHEKIIQMYKDAHVYVSAGWNDGGPLPPQEALLMSVPVVTTRVGMMPEVIKPGFNGEFFDGTINDLKDKLQMIEENFHHYSLGAEQTWMNLPTVQKTSDMYMEMWTKVLEDEE